MNMLAPTASEAELLVGLADPVAFPGGRDQPPAAQADDQANRDAIAELFREQLQQPGFALTSFGAGQRNEEQQERYRKSVIEPRLDV
jgi:hypothetical protein